MRIRIEGHDLPGRGARHRDVHVGIQVRQRVVQTYPADVPTAVWICDAEVVRRPDGTLDIRGPGIHGRPGDRFLYLSWGTVAAEAFAMFRRAKLMLADVDDAMLQAATTSGHVLVARLGLTAADGTPRCAAVRPPAIVWSVEVDVDGT